MKTLRTGKRRLSNGVENLEPRMVQAQFGVAWNDAMHLTMSFVRDQTAVVDLQSDLVAALDSQMPRATWQSAILQAAQSWMQAANVNIGLTTDSGLELGVPGPTQGDSRFGDIRIGGYRMDNSVLAVSVPPGAAAGTFAGDIFINTAVQFTPASLRATMLHEFGHVLGLGHSSDPLSVMSSHLNNRTQLAASDIAAIRALYGVRTADQNELKKNNNALSNGTRVKYSQVSGGYTGSTPLVVWGDLSTASDVDYFFVPALAGYTGPMTFRLQTDGISLATPKITVLDASGRSLGQSTSQSNSSDSITVTLPSVIPDRRYFVRVESAAGSSHRVGRYAMAVTFDQLLQPTATPLQTVMKGPYEYLAPEKVDLLFKDPSSLIFDDDFHANDTEAGAVTLKPLAGQTDKHLSTQGTLTDTTDIDFYRVKTPATGSNWVLTLSALATEPNSIQPRITVQDANSVPVPVCVIANGNGNYSIQASGLAANRTFFIKVFSPNRQTGNYTLLADFGTVPAELNTFLSSQTTSAVPTVDGKLYVAQPQLFNFALSAEGSSGSVTMTIKDRLGNVVETLTATAGDVSTSISRMLPPGEYSFSFSSTAPQRFTLRGSKLTDPVGPVLDSSKLQPQYVSPSNPNTYVYPDGTVSSVSYFWLMIAMG